MRTSSNPEDTEGWFIDDIPSGTIIECGRCFSMITNETQPEKPCHCPHCGVELFYRPWWEW